MLFAKSLAQLKVANFRIVNILGFNSVRSSPSIPFILAILVC
jgi:hypothetical protein